MTTKPKIASTTDRQQICRIIIHLIVINMMNIKCSFSFRLRDSATLADIVISLTNKPFVLACKFRPIGKRRTSTVPIGMIGAGHFSRDFHSRLRTDDMAGQVSRDFRSRFRAVSTSMQKRIGAGEFGRDFRSRFRGMGMSIESTMISFLSTFTGGFSHALNCFRSVFPAFLGAIKSVILSTTCDIALPNLFWRQLLTLVRQRCRRVGFTFIPCFMAEWNAITVFRQIMSKSISGWLSALVNGGNHGATSTCT